MKKILKKLLIHSVLPLLGIANASAAITCNGVTYNGPNSGWTDSVEVNGKCYCASTNFDHNAGTLVPAGYNGLTVKEICDILGEAPAGTQIPYNDVQCGNGPANDAGDEDADCCPGRVNEGASGCLIKGPTWDKDAVLGTTTSLPKNGDDISIKGSNNKYLSSENGTKDVIVNRTAANSWETFEVVDLSNGYFALKGNNGKFGAVRNSTATRFWASNNTRNSRTHFELVSTGNGQIAFKSVFNGKYMSSENGNRNVRVNRSSIGTWETFTWSK